MGVPTSEVGYTAAMPRTEEHEVHKDMWWHWTKKISSTWVNTRMDMSDRGLSYLFQRSRGGCEWFDKLQNYVGEVFLHFEIERNSLSLHGVPTDKNVKDWGRAKVGAVPRRLLFADIY